MTVTDAALVLADGSVFEGEAIGAVPTDGVSTGEVVFNTVLTGYQEVITDPSYAAQIITFTYPHIGNYGTNPTDNQASRTHCRGVIVRDLARRASNWRSTDSLDHFLTTHGIAGIAGIDTRRLTRHLRDHGAMPGAFGPADVATLEAAAQNEPGTDGVDLVATVTTDEMRTVACVSDDAMPRRIVAIDIGIKHSIVTMLSEVGEITVVPASTTPEQIRALEPHGVFLSNGPGDPEMVATVPDTIKSLLGEIPIFGICLGHQMLALALGGETYKLPFGHHGGNHPVRNLATNEIEITSQNHNFCVAADSLPNATISHLNLNDGTVEGLTVNDAAAFSVQYHPEASPGPHDSSYLFGEFAALIDRFHGGTR